MNGEALTHLRELPENSVDAIITDPPYGLSFMNKHWDYDVPSVEIWKECLRVLKHGGHLLSFAGTRTYHRMTCNVEDAGFEIRDMISWLYGSGFPKSLNIGKQIDKINGKKQEDFIALGVYLKEKRGNKPMIEVAKYFPSKTGGITGCVSNWELGLNVPTKDQWKILKRELNLNNAYDWLIDRIEAEREVVGTKISNAQDQHNWLGEKYNKHESNEVDITLPATPEAKEWEGWGTALKPACEPIVVARKPLSEKNVALNVLRWGTGGINIDGCRIGIREIERFADKKSGTKNAYGNYFYEKSETPLPPGRFPANVILDEEAGQLLDEQSGNQTGAFAPVKQAKRDNNVYGDYEYFGDNGETFRGDKGGASRFFYCAKASKSERNLGLNDLEEKQMGRNQSSFDGGELLTGSGNKRSNYRKNNHPTVKPLKLMEYLVKLITKENQIVLDPFLGSGTTVIACIKLNRNWLGIEREAEYVKIAEARIKYYSAQRSLPIAA